jgi:hypothetical protein
MLNRMCFDWSGRPLWLSSHAASASQQARDGNILVKVLPVQPDPAQLDFVRAVPGLH